MRIALSEYEKREVGLTAGQAGALDASFRRAVGVHPTEREGRYQLTARHYIGTIALNGVEIRIRPKCPTASLFHMLSYALDIAELRHDPTGYDDADDISDMLLLLFAQKTERLVYRSGLRHEYRVEEEELGALRGRLVLEKHLRRGVGSSILLPCRYEELTADLPINQVIRYTLQVTAPSRSELVAGRLRRLRKRMSEVSLRRFYPRDIDCFDYHRLIEHYRPVHRLCKLLLELQGLDHHVGRYPLGTFLLDMKLLFERFVTNWLTEHVSSPLTVTGQLQRPLDRSGTVLLKPDIAIRRHDAIVAVADTKYKRMDGGSTAAREDTYQALAYCRGLDVRRCVLIYPDWTKPPRTIRVTDGENEIVLDGIDIARPPAELEVAMEALLGRLLGRKADRERAGLEVALLT